MPRLGTAFAARVLALALFELDSRAVLAQPAEGTRRELEVVGSCPTAEAVDGALAPLLKRDFSFPGGARPRVVDRGDRFAVSVKGQTGQYLDAERDCAERARVSAVFIALTLNPPQIQSSDVDASPPKPSAFEAPARLPAQSVPSPQVVAPRTDAWRRLDIGARFDAAPSAGPPSMLAAGLELRLSLGTGRVGGVLGTSVLAPVVWELSGVLVQEQRLPSHLALRMRWPSMLPTLSLDLGLSATVFVVRAPELAGGSPATRLDMGPRAALTAQFETFGSLSPYLGAHLEYFPQTYRLYAEPTGQLAATPHLWVGMNLGASLALN